MSLEQWRKMKIEDLENEERALREKLFNMRSKHSLGRLKETHMINRVKKDIARVCSIKTEKQREIKNV